MSNINSNIKISLNAGHLVGKDSGAVGNGYHEADLVNIAQDETSRVLREQYVLDLEDTDKLYTDDVAEANAFGAHYAIEYHLNSSSNPTSNGFETFVYPNHKESLTLQKALHPLTFDIVKKHGVTSRDRGQKASADFYYLSGTKMPAIIIEFCFINNPTEAKAFANKAKAIGADMAHAIAKACGLPKKQVTPQPSKYVKEYPETGEFYITTGKARYNCDVPSLTSKELGTVPHSTWIKYEYVVYNDGRIWVRLNDSRYPKGYVSVGSYENKAPNYKRTEAFAKFD